MPSIIISNLLPVAMRRLCVLLFKLIYKIDTYNYLLKISSYVKSVDITYVGGGGGGCSMNDEYIKSGSGGSGIVCIRIHFKDF